MGTAAVSQAKHTERTRQQDRLFFSGITLLVLIAVFVGFARTYLLAGVFWAKLPNQMVHIHGALFTLWIALLVTQVALVASHRTRWHIRLGVAGMLLAPLMVCTGFATLIAAIRRGFVPPPALQRLTAVDTLLLLLFAFFISWAFLARHNGPTHKRLILFATFFIIIPAIARWPIAQNPVIFYIFLNSFPALLVVHDLWTRRSLHRATVCGVVLMFSLQLIVPVLAPSALIDRAVVWLQRT